MSIAWAFFLGAIQGITEILPISSSAHLIIAPKLFNLPDQGLSFDVALHLGSLLAIAIAFKSDWLKLFKSALELPKKKFKYSTKNQKLIYYLVLGTIPAAVAGYFLEDLADSTFRSEYIIVFTLIFYGALLWIAEVIGKKTKDLKKITLKDSLIIGFAQALALIPGTSRSGVTITAGLFSGLNKETAAKFSFMLSAPIILGAGLLKISQIPLKELLSTPMVVGFVSAFFFALISIKFLLSFVRKSSYKWFSIYRFALAGLILIFIIGS
jgi:undecaprenyl-diphosphatase